MHHRARFIGYLLVALTTVIAAVGLLAVMTPPAKQEVILTEELPIPTIQIPPSSQSPEPIRIEPSAAQRIYIPNTDKELEISTRIRTMPTSCRQVIDPPRSGPTVGDIFACNDYDLPGSGSSTSILAGHSSLHLTTWLNRLYRQGDQLVGREILIQTVASGSKWLVYKVTNVFTPHNEELPYMQDIWGSPGERPVERLVVVTCLQDTEGEASTRNYVAVAQLTDVR